MTETRDGPSLADQLTKLTELRDSGAITAAEFEAAKQRVLGMAGVGAAATELGRAAAPRTSDPPDLPSPGVAPSPTGAVPLPVGGLGPLPTTEVLPDIAAEELTLPEPEPDPDPEPEPEPEPEMKLDSTPGVSDRDGLSLEWRPAAPKRAQGEAEQPGKQAAVEPPPQGPPGGNPPALAPSRPSADSGAQQRLKRQDLGGSATRTVWLIGGGVLAVLVLLLVVLLYMRGASVQHRRAEKNPGKHDAPQKQRPVVDDGDNDAAERPRRRGVRWRPVGALSCVALQDRVDDCEEEWADQLELLLRQTNIGKTAARLSVDRPRLAVRQAQGLVFENGELHRCQVAQARQMPLETEWLRAAKACIPKKQCKRFSACHTKAFVRYIGQLPFSCRFYCNKEMYQCGAAVMASGLQKSRGYQGVADEDALDKVRPRLFASCLTYCKKKLTSSQTREAVLQCMFQPSCKGFVGCLEKIPEN